MVSTACTCILLNMHLSDRCTLHRVVYFGGGIIHLDPHINIPQVYAKGNNNSAYIVCVYRSGDYSVYTICKGA